MRDLRDVGHHERQLRHLLADRLQALVDAGLTADLLATAAGVDDATVQDWLMQRALPDTSVALRLSEVQVVHGGSG